MTAGTDVAKAAKAAGFPDDQLVTAVAIAYAESSFNAAAVAHEPNGTYSYGLWQINSVHGYPELAAGGPWQQPNVNAQLAKRVFDKQGWGAWSTFSPSDPVGYARYTAARPAAVGYVAAAVGAKAAAAGALDTPGAVAAGIADDAGAALTVAAEIAKEPLSVLRWLTRPDTWVRIAYVVAGGALVVGGVWLLINSTLLSAVGPIATELVGGKAKLAADALGGGKTK